MTFEADRYEPGFDVPLSERKVTVDISRDDGVPRIEVNGGRYRWKILQLEEAIVAKVDTETETRWRPGQLPNWLLVVLDHVGYLCYLPEEFGDRTGCSHSDSYSSAMSNTSEITSSNESPGPFRWFRRDHVSSETRTVTVSATDMVELWRSV